MKETDNIVKQVRYITYEYESTEEKERHIVNMENNGYECLDRFEDQDKAIFRNFMTVT